VPLAIHVPDDVVRTVATFERIIDAPILTDVAVDWGALAIDAVFPRTAPDLFASRPLVVHGRYTAPSRRPDVHAARRGRPAFGHRPDRGVGDGERSDVLAACTPAPASTTSTCAAPPPRTRSSPPRPRQQILATGLEYHLVTAFTSLVAIDHGSAYVGPHTTVVQPVEVPARRVGRAGVRSERRIARAGDWRRSRWRPAPRRTPRTR
jgi:Ca-activated chloride channel family protein